MAKNFPPNMISISKYPRNVSMPKIILITCNLCKGEFNQIVSIPETEFHLCPGCMTSFLEENKYLTKKIKIFMAREKIKKGKKWVYLLMVKNITEVQLMFAIRVW